MAYLLGVSVFLAIIFCVKAQNYIIHQEKVELVSYNASLVKGNIVFGFKTLNQTAFSFNVTFETVRESKDEKLMIKLQCDKLMGGNYIRLAGQLSANVCKFWKKNTFGMKDDLSKYGNLEACKIEKKKYYLYNYIPDSSLFPKYIPFGTYRLIIEMFHSEGAELFTMHWYASIVKP